MKTSLLLALIVFATPGAFAQSNSDENVNDNPVTVQLSLDSKEVKPGGMAKVVVTMVVAPDHHAYRDMMGLKWMGAESVTFDELQVTPVKEFKDPFSKKTRDVVEGKATITALAHFPMGLKAGPHNEKVTFRYQACSSRYCLFPKTVELPMIFSVVASDDSGASASSGGAGGEFQKALAKGKAWAFLFVFIGGFLTSLTPCIFPMIPITISIIGARSAQNKKSRSFGLSLSYVLGIATTYSALGVIAASTGAFFGSALSNIWIVSGISVIFIVMGVSMLGLFEMQVPVAIRNKFGNANTGTGFPGAYLAGTFAGLVASPCIGPVLVGILTYVAQTAQVAFGFFLLFTFAMGMGILFLVLGTFSGLLTKIPKAGPWMETVKFVFGITFISMAFFYWYPVLSRPVFLGILALVLFWFSSYYGAFTPAPNTRREQVQKGMMLATFFIAVTLVAMLIFTQFGLIPAQQVGANANGEGASSMARTDAPSAKGMQWRPYADRVIASVAQNHRPVIVDFYADWCVACHELDHYTYNDPGVVEKSKEFDLLKIDATTPSADLARLQKEYHVVGLPTVVFIDPSGKVRTDLTVTGFVKGDEFLDRMKRDF